MTIFIEVPERRALSIKAKYLIVGLIRLWVYMITNHGIISKVVYIDTNLTDWISCGVKRNNALIIRILAT